MVVASNMFVLPHLRERARQAIGQFRYQCCYQIDMALRVLEESWRRIDMGADDAATDWREVMVELGCTTILG